MIVRLWWLSTRLHRKGLKRIARGLSVYIRLVYRADLPAEADIQRDLVLFHGGIGVVVNPSVIIESNVRIVHGVTIGCIGPVGAQGRVIIRSGARIGAGAVILAPRDQDLIIGENCQVGACAYVRESMPPNSVALAAPATIRPVSQP